MYMVHTGVNVTGFPFPSKTDGPLPKFEMIIIPITFQLAGLGSVAQVILSKTENGDFFTINACWGVAVAIGLYSSIDVSGECDGYFHFPLAFFFSLISQIIMILSCHEFDEFYWIFR